MNHPVHIDDKFLTAFKGSFIGILRWPELDQFWRLLKLKADDHWYIYAIGDTPPENPVTSKLFLKFIQDIDELLRKEHKEDYCGVVYVDNKLEPSFIKIFDPNNLGVSCGYSDNPPLPGWVISRIKPADLASAQIQTASRKRWWQKIFAG